MQWFIELAPAIGGVLELAAAALNAFGVNRDRRRQHESTDDV
jgi:hypothetical protein